MDSTLLTLGFSVSFDFPPKFAFVEPLLTVYKVPGFVSFCKVNSIVLLSSSHGATSALATPITSFAELFTLNTEVLIALDALLTDISITLLLIATADKISRAITCSV